MTRAPKSVWVVYAVGAVALAGGLWTADKTMSAVLSAGVAAPFFALGAVLSAPRRRACGNC